MIVMDLIPRTQFDWLTKTNFSSREACFCIVAVITTIDDKKLTGACVAMETTSSATVAIVVTRISDIDFGSILVISLSACAG